MPSLGEVLKEERLKRGINLKELERITKIRSKYLLAIEKGEFSVLPGTTYARAFIKAYANALGLDSFQFVDEFTKVYQGTSKDPEHASRVAAQSDTISSRAISPNRRLGYSTTRPIRKSSNVPIAIGAVVILILFVFIFNGLKSLWSSQEKSGMVNDKKVENNVNPGASEKKDSGKDMKVKNVDQKPQSTLVLKAVKPGSWVRITVDDKVNFQGILEAGMNKSVKGSKFKVRAGNAGSVYVTLDKKSLGKLGSTGQIVEKTYLTENKKKD